MSGKFALIIGNTEYIDPGLAQLTAPGKDAEDFARVLKDREIGAFDEVNILLNQPEYIIRGTIDEFFDQKRPDDLLVLYFSGHGVRDELGALYLAVKNTIRTRLRSTAIKSEYIREAMDQSRSKRQVLILDCCNSGAFPQGTKAELGGSMGMTKAFQGYGRFVLTASDATQFAWEGDKIIGETDNSLFTHFLVKGLEGEADSDGDGKITVDELYDFAYEQISRVTPKQTPTKSASKQEGEIVLRQSTRIENIKPVSLPDEIIEAIEDTRPFVREVTVQQLEKLLKGKNLGLARSAREALEKIADQDDSRRVAQAALQALESIRQAEQLAAQRAQEEKQVREQAELLAAQKVEEERIAHEREEEERRAREELERRVREKVEAEWKAQEEAKRLASQKAEEERLAREKAEAERKAKQEAERLARAKAEREATELAARQAAEKAAKEKAAKEAAEKAEREAVELAARKKAEREAKENVTGEERKATRPSWLTFGIIGGTIIALALCGYTATRFFPALVGGANPPTQAPATELAATPLPTQDISENPTVEPTSAQVPTPQLANPVIHIWKVGSPHEGNTPDNTIPLDLQNAAAVLGYQLIMETFPAKGFDKVFFDAVQTNTQPDILAFDNYGIIEGITTDLGTFEGIGNNSLIFVNGSFVSLESNQGGWEVLVSTSQNFEGARQFALSYGKECDAKFIGNLNDLNASIVTEIKGLAIDATLEYFGRDSKALDDLSGGQYAKESLAIPDIDITIHNTNICSLWGNERIAFVESLATFETTGSLGQNRRLIVLSNSGSSWKLLLISDYTGIIQELYQQVSLLPSEQVGESINKPILLGPPDQANLPRFTDSTSLEWTTTGTTTVVYLIEYQFGYDSWWSGSGFTSVQPSSLTGETAKVPIPFGVGHQQPHRWRVWAIDKSGNFEISEWRIINFTN